MVSAFERVRASLVPLLTVIVGLWLEGVGGAPTRMAAFEGGGGVGIVELFPPAGCHRNSPQLRECVGSAVQQFANFMSSGRITPGHTITPFDPLHLPNMTILQDRRVKAVLVNRYLVGLKKSFIQDVRMNLDRLEFNVTVLLPALEMLGLFSSARPHISHATDHSILTFSLRNTVVQFAAKGSLYSGRVDPSGPPAKHLRLRLGVESMSIGSCILDESLDLDQRLAGARTSWNQPVAPTKFTKLIRKDLRVQLAKRMQHVANEALALTPFVRLFPV
ncbi:uncharacterized protein LOC128727756 [Anopheles nili]|uniref:uncharacterized protein LOC128727756 n=1 Tax=Anopheles nili TaxID=185578 RepID=UPI00237ACB4F|nr:uncharacterized protein LOC128727756 [Anopheles nili]